MVYFGISTTRSSSATTAWSATTALSHRLRRWSIHFDFGNRQVRPGQTGASLHNVCWEFHARKIFVSGVGLFNKKVADDVVLDLGLYFGNHVLIIDVAGNGVRNTGLRFLFDLERNGSMPLSIDIALRDGGLCSSRGQFQESRRR